MNTEEKIINKYNLKMNINFFICYVATNFLNCLLGKNYN
jgi:hypothetical protein